MFLSHVDQWDMYIEYLEYYILSKTDPSYEGTDFAQGGWQLVRDYNMINGTKYTAEELLELLFESEGENI